MPTALMKNSSGNFIEPKIESISAAAAGEIPVEPGAEQGRPQVDRTVKLKFSASSEPELISWILSFGDGARVVKPEWLIEEVVSTVNKMRDIYNVIK